MLFRFIRLINTSLTRDITLSSEPRRPERSRALPSMSGVQRGVTADTLQIGLINTSLTRDITLSSEPRRPERRRALPNMSGVQWGVAADILQTRLRNSSLTRYITLSSEPRRPERRRALPSMSGVQRGALREYVLRSDSSERSGVHAHCGSSKKKIRWRPVVRTRPKQSSARDQNNAFVPMVCTRINYWAAAHAGTHDPKNTRSASAAVAVTFGTRRL